MAVTTQAMIPVKPMVPLRHPIQKARRRVVESRARWRGIRATQASNPRSNLGKQNGSRTPLAQARAIWRARVRSIERYHNQSDPDLQENERKLVTMNCTAPSHLAFGLAFAAT